MEDTKDARGATTEETSSPKKEGDVVSYEAHQKLLAQFKKSQVRLEQLQEKDSVIEQLSGKLTALESERQAKEEEKLMAKGEQSKIIELREQRIKELEEKMNAVAMERDTLNEQITTSDKIYAFYEKLPGKLKNNAYLKHVALDEIVLDPETGQPDSQSVDTVVNKFMELYPETVDTKSGKRLPGDAAMANNPILPNNFKNLSLEDMKKNMKQAVQAAKIQRGVK